MKTLLKQSVIAVLVALAAAAMCGNVALAEDRAAGEPAGEANTVVMTFKRIRLQFAASDVKAEDAMAELESAGVNIPHATGVCADNGLTDAGKARMRDIEVDLELEFMMDSLEQESPPALTENQREFLNRVPLCKPFLSKLRIIGLLLKGFKVAQRP